MNLLKKTSKVSKYISFGGKRYALNFERLKEVCLTSSSDGVSKEMEITQELRQQMFDSQETTDDHGMEIIGTARDRKGNRYYKVRNSWDTNQIYDGFLYVSEPYFLAKTVGILVNKEAVPASIAKKFKK